MAAACGDAGTEAAAGSGSGNIAAFGGCGAAGEHAW